MSVGYPVFRQQKLWQEVLADRAQPSSNQDRGREKYHCHSHARLETKKLLTDPKIGSNYAMVDYGFIPVRDTTDIDADDHAAVMHTWVLDNPAYKYGAAVTNQ